MHTSDFCSESTFVKSNELRYATNTISYIVLYSNRFMPSTNNKLKNQTTKIKKTCLTLQQLETCNSKVHQLAPRVWHQGDRQEDLLTRGGSGDGRWWSWRIISNRRWRASRSFIHAWCWWHRFWFLAGTRCMFTGDLLYLGSIECILLYQTCLLHISPVAWVSPPPPPPWSASSSVTN